MKHRIVPVVSVRRGDRVRAPLLQGYSRPAYRHGRNTRWRQELAFACSCPRLDEDSLRQRQPEAQAGQWVKRAIDGSYWFLGKAGNAHLFLLLIFLEHNGEKQSFVTRFEVATRLSTHEGNSPSFPTCME